jgi:DNA-binding MarR family transcriptional regulator
MTFANVPRSKNLKMANRLRRDEIADKLHAAAVHLLRRLRRVDPAMGLTPACASALSVIVFGRPMTLGDLAAAEQIRPASLTPIVRELEYAGLVKRQRDAKDRRVVQIQPTAKGRRLLQQGRGRRVSMLAKWLGGLDQADIDRLAACADLIERIVRDADT